MFKYLFSFKFGNIHPTNVTGDITTTSTTSNSSNAFDKNIVKGVNNDITSEKMGAGDSPIQLVRQQRRQQLEETALIRKIAHQSFMNQYAVDHLPLSQLQEKLEEDNLPLIQLQEKLKQKEDDLTVYTTTKENLRSLFHHPRKRNGLTMQPRKFRRTVPTVVMKNHHDDDDNNNNDNNNNSTKDDRDYDVWDDAVIGHIMNLVDTIGTEPGEAIQEIESTMINDDVTSKNESPTFSENTLEDVEEENDSNDKESIIDEDIENQSTEVEEEMIDYDQTLDVTKDRKLSYDESIEKKNTTVIQITTLTTTFTIEKPNGLMRDSGYEDYLTSLSIENNNKRESGFFRKRQTISFFNNKDDDLSSINSNSTRGTIGDVGFDNRNKSSIRKPLPFLKKLWKSKCQQNQIKENSLDQLVSETRSLSMDAYRTISGTQYVDQKLI